MFYALLREARDQVFESHLLPAAREVNLL